MMYLVYQIHNLVNNKIYVGVHKTFDPDDSYLGSGVAIIRAVKKYGRDNFKKTILHSFDNAESAYLTEKEIVDIAFVARPDTYNMKTGGIGGWEYSEETRQKISDANTGKVRSEETRQKLRDANIGKVLSEETRQKMCIARANRIVSEETRQKLRNANTGKMFSEETRQQMRDAHKKKFKITYPDGKEEMVQLKDWAATTGLDYRAVQCQINKGIISENKKMTETRRFLIGYRIDRME
jgi:group I intron endonuclease